MSTDMDREARIVESCKTAQHLSLDIGDLERVIRLCPPCPELKFLEIKKSSKAQKHEEQISFNIDTLTHYMEQPSMRELVVWDVSVFEDESAPSQSSSGEKQISLRGLSTLKLRQVSVTASVLGKILRDCDHLRSFTLTRPIGNGLISLQDLPAVLQQNIPSLQSLTLGYHSRHKTREPTLLSSLRDMEELKHLKIDPAMFVGHRVCSQPHGAFDVQQPIHQARRIFNFVRQRMLKEFANLLPDNLETLTLDFDQEQIMRNPMDRSDIVGCILQAKPRLTQLQAITMVEDVSTYQELCNCQRCYLKTNWASDDDDDDPAKDEMEQNKRMARQAAEIGVALLRDLSDGKGRWKFDFEEESWELERRRG